MSWKCQTCLTLRHLYICLCIACLYWNSLLQIGQTNSLIPVWCTRWPLRLLVAEKRLSQNGQGYLFISLLLLGSSWSEWSSSKPPLLVALLRKVDSVDVQWFPFQVSDFLDEYVEKVWVPHHWVWKKWHKNVS